MTEPTLSRWGSFAELITDDSDVEIVEKFTLKPDSTIELLLAVESSEPDAVVLYGKSDSFGIISHLLSEYPDLVVLFLCESGEVFIEERSQCRTSLLDDSPERISQALHDAVLNHTSDNPIQVLQ